MYSTVHMAVAGVVGEATLYATEGLLGTTGAYILAGALAFWSHTEVDRLGEASVFNTFEEAVLFEGMVLGSMVLFSYYFVFGISGVIFGFLGLLIDVIDKFRYHILGLKQVFPSHRRGFKMWYFLTKEQTIWSIVIATMLPVLSALAIVSGVWK